MFQFHNFMIDDSAQSRDTTYVIATFLQKMSLKSTMNINNEYILTRNIDWLLTTQNNRCITIYRQIFNNVNDGLNRECKVDKLKECKKAL